MNIRSHFQPAVCAAFIGSAVAANTAFAGPYVPITVPDLVPTLGAPAGPELHPGKEYSNEPDRDNIGVPDDQQNIMWDGSGGAADTFDYNGIDGVSGNPNAQVDALAHPGDAFFSNVVDNSTAILYSLRDGINVQGTGVDVLFGDARVPVLYETTGGTQGAWATWDQLNQHGGQNLDGLEVFGPEGSDDAYRYSLFNDAAGANNGGVGCSIYDVSAGCWLSHTELATLFPEIDPTRIDLDALMLLDNQVMFSLWPVFGPDQTTLIAGDEVWVWDRTSGAIGFLNHGGHLWDSGWTSDYFGRIYNVDALEAGAQVSAVPEPASLALLGIGLAGMAMRRRRLH